MISIKCTSQVLNVMEATYGIGFTGLCVGTYMYMYMYMYIYMYMYRHF